VTPVVSLLTDNSVLETLRPAAEEVDLIFDHPLPAILEPHLSKGEPLVELNSKLWPSSDPFYVRGAAF
jgi:peroxisomal coenzyme A diphosphatase NUDT7